MGGKLTPQQWLRAGLLAGAFVLTLIALFTPWWTLAFASGGSASDTSARPYDAGDFKDDEDGGLTLEAILTGLFVTIALGGITAFLAVELLPLGGKSAPALVKLVAAAVAALFGLVAVIYTATAWPSAATGGSELGFFDSVETEGFSGFGVNTPPSKVSTYAGLGWYLAIVGSILLPAAAFVHGTVLPGTDGAPATTPPPPAAPAFKLSQPVYEPAATARASKLVEARTVTTRAASKKK